MLKIPIEVSGRHIHLTEKTYYKLFCEKPKMVKKLSQKNYFLINKRLDIYNSKKNIKIENVGIIFPFRDKNQIEISNTDAKKLFANQIPKRVISGNLDEAFDIFVFNKENNKKLLLKKSTILAKAHIHISKEFSKKYDIKNNKKYTLCFKNQKIKVVARISEDYFNVCHIDSDEAKRLKVSKENKRKQINNDVYLNYCDYGELILH